MLRANWLRRTAGLAVSSTGLYHLGLGHPQVALSSAAGGEEHDNNVWEPPSRIEKIFEKTSGNRFASINSPTAGARVQKALPHGNAPFQLYSLATPNGHKVGIMLEELGIDYDAHYLKIWEGEQFYSGFVEINPNSKVPCAVDNDGPTGEPIHLFESGAMVWYLGEKYGKFIPSDPKERMEALQWIIWQMAGQGPISGNYGHFMVYAPDNAKEARDYGVGRYGMDVQRVCDVLDKHLEGKEYMVGNSYSVADIVCFPWFQQLRQGYNHPSGVQTKDFLQVDKYKNACAWADRILARPAVKRGMQVCSAGVGKPWLKESEKSKL